MLIIAVSIEVVYFTLFPAKNIILYFQSEVCLPTSRLIWNFNAAGYADYEVGNAIYRVFNNKRDLEFRIGRYAKSMIKIILNRLTTKIDFHCRILP